MADLNAVQYDKYYIDNPPTIGASGNFDGRMKVMYDTYEFAAASIGDEVLFGKKLQSGAVIHEVTIYNDALGASTTLAVASRTLDAGTETVFFSAQSTSSAGKISTDASDIDTIPHVLSEDSILILQLAGGAATGTVKVRVVYSEH